MAMVKAANIGFKSLTERVVRNEDLFCSLLFDHSNRTLRVVDFRGGNFQSKHAYLDQVLMKEGMRKIFTLIERDDMNGWQRVGYSREGAIPGYYKRSDAYIMARIYDGDFDLKEAQGEELAENKNFLNDVKNMGKKLSEQREPSVKVEQVAESEVRDLIRSEFQRLEEKSAKGKASKGGKAGAAKPAKAKKGKTAQALLGNGEALVFPQFSREVEHLHFLIQNRRTKQINVLSAEYQDCFGNAKVHFCLSPETRPDQNLARAGLSEAIDQLVENGAVSVFATVPTDDLKQNAVFAAIGFRNTGWMNRQLVTPKGIQDVVLWTKKLI
jgi:hypothetical protein